MNKTAGKKIRYLALLAVFISLILCVLFAACTGREFHVVYFASRGGTIVGDVNQYVKRGGDATEVTAEPKDGYKFLEWSDGLLTATRKDLAVSSDLSLTAAFEKLPPVPVTDPDDEENPPPEVEPPIIIPQDTIDIARNELEQKIVWINSLNEEDYAPPFWAEIHAAFAIASDVCDDENATIEELIEALRSIERLFNPEPPEVVEPPVFDAIFVYTLKSDGTYAVKCVNPLEERGFIKSPVLIPSVFEGKAVTEISASGFRDFYIDAIIIPDSVRVIGDFAFSGCTRLKVVTLPRVERVGEEAFALCIELEEVYLPDTLTFVDKCAFRGSDNVTVNVELNKAQTLSWSPLWAVDCMAVNYLDITESLDDISIEAEFKFTLNSDRFSYSVELLTTGIALYYIKTLVFPKSYNGLPVTSETVSYRTTDMIRLETMYVYFTDKTVLSSLRNAPNLKAIYLPDVSTSFGIINSNIHATIYLPFGEERTAAWNSAWAGQCTVVYNHVWDTEPPATGTVPLETAVLRFLLKSDNTYRVSLASTTAEKKLITSVIIPETYQGIAVTEIMSSAFANCPILETVVIPASVTIIGAGAFMFCYKLKAVDLSNVKRIEQQAFRLCEELGEVYLPSTLEYVGASAFAYTDATIYVPFDEEMTENWASNWADEWCTVIYNYQN